MRVHSQLHYNSQNDWMQKNVKSSELCRFWQVLAHILMYAEKKRNLMTQEMNQVLLQEQSLKTTNAHHHWLLQRFVANFNRTCNNSLFGFNNILAKISYLSCRVRKYRIPYWQHGNRIKRTCIKCLFVSQEMT